MLIDIVNSGGGLEDMIRKHEKYIDQDLLEAMYRRIETAAKHGKVWCMESEFHGEMNSWFCGKAFENVSPRSKL